MQLEWSLKYRYHFYPFIASNIKLRLLSKVLKKFIYKNIYLFLTGLLIFVLIFLFLCVIDPIYNLQYHAFKEFKPFDSSFFPSFHLLLIDYLLFYLLNSFYGCLSVFQENFEGFHLGFQILVMNLMNLLLKKNFLIKFRVNCVEILQILSDLSHFDSLVFKCFYQ